MKEFPGKCSLTHQEFRDIELIVIYPKIGDLRSFDFVSTSCLEIFLSTWKCFYFMKGNFLIKIEKVKMGLLPTFCEFWGHSIPNRSKNLPRSEYEGNLIIDSSYI